MLMNELIWFSIPGAVLLFAAGLLFPSLRAAPDTLLVAAAPVSGFLFHQFYRTVFELFGGWASSRRPVVAAIRSAYAIPATDHNTPFLIWETTFYSDGIPESFRAHNRGAWHYIMSFRSIWWSSALGAICLLVVPRFWGGASQSIGCVLSFVVVSVVFFLKAHLTYSSLGRQEVACFQHYRSAFDATRNAIV